MKTVIYCAGYYGRLLREMIQKELFDQKICSEDEVFFCDSMLYKEKYIDGCKVLSPEELCYLSDDYRVLISSPQNVDSVMEQLNKLGVKCPVYLVPEYVYRFAWNDSNMPPFLEIDMSKPRLRLFQVPIIESCNLNCTGCILTYNEGSKVLMDIQEFVGYMEDLHRLYSGIKHFTILGGEPFLHPQLDEFVREARRAFPDAELDIRTNGTLVCKTDERLLKAISANDAEIWISLYPPMEEKVDDVSSFLRKNNIRYRILGPFNYFRKLVNIKGDYDPEHIFSKCDKCINFFDGYLSCGYGKLIEKLEKRFGIKICEDEYKEYNCFNIHTTDLNGWEINERLGKPSLLCAYCAYQNWGEDDENILFPWSCGRKPELDDWIVR